MLSGAEGASLLGGAGKTKLSALALHVKLGVAAAVALAAGGAAAALGVVYGVGRGGSADSGGGGACASTYNASAPPCGAVNDSQRVSQVHVHFGADAARLLAVAWAEPSAGCASGVVGGGADDGPRRVEFGASWCALDFSSAADATNYSTSNRTTSFGDYSSPTLLNASINAAAAGVQPGGTVYYRVGGGACGWSCVYAAATAPLPGATAAGTRFAVLGDVGVTDFAAGTLQGVLAAHEARPFAAAVLVGDLSYANGFGPLWDDFGEQMQFVAARLPIMSTPGNHGELARLAQVSVPGSARASRSASPPPQQRALTPLPPTNDTAKSGSTPTSPSRPICTTCSPTSRAMAARSPSRRRRRSHQASSIASRRASCTG